MERPVVKISAIYHRNDPIITGDPPLKTYLHIDIYMYIRGANIWSSMERAGIPEVKRGLVPIYLRQHRRAGDCRRKI
jgi:hypothetical protein